MIAIFVLLMNDSRVRGRALNFFYKKAKCRQRPRLLTKREPIYRAITILREIMLFPARSLLK